MSVNSTALGKARAAAATIRRGFDGPFAELQHVEQRAASVWYPSPPGAGSVGP